MILNVRIFRLLTLLALLSVTHLYFEFRHTQERGRATTEFQSRLDQQFLRAIRFEQVAIENGGLWKGSFHRAQFESVRETSPSTNSLIAQQQVAKTVEFQNGLSVSVNLHECDPGSKHCTSGGTFDIRDSRGLISTVSLSLFQPGRGSTYRVEWQAGSGQHWTHEEKLTLMKTLGGVATGLDSKGIQQLLQAAYLAGGMTENAGQSLISSIFRSIVDDSRR